jgi:predicted  nucleic acid-binding Zn-ribbon protein
MAKNKIRRPKKSNPAPAPQVPVPELGNDPDSLVSEFKVLEIQLSNINNIIKNGTDQITNHQNQIAQARNEGQTILGKLDVLVRILSGMGIDPNNYQPNQEVEDEEIPAEEPDFFDENEEIEAEVVDIKRDAKIEAIKRRLGK